MRTSIVAGSALAASLAAFAVAAPLQAQLVRADVVVRSGPVRGHVVIDDGYSTYRRPPVVVYERPARVIVVERFRNRGEWRRWKRHGYQQISLYYVDGRYYDRGRSGAREVVVYERNGHYYRDCDDDRYDRNRRRDDDHYRDRDRDRHHDRDHDRWD